MARRHVFAPIWKIPAGERVPHPLACFAMGATLSVLVAAACADYVVSARRLDAAGDHAGAQHAIDSMVLVIGVWIGVVAVSVLIGVIAEGARRKRIPE